MAARAFPSRIRLHREDGLTPHEHQASFRIAYAEPNYPAEARAQRIEGTVILDAVIDKEGIIQKLEVREGHPILAESALQCVRDWVYRPTKLNGRPVEVVTEIEVRFALPDDCAELPERQ